MKIENLSKNRLGTQGRKGFTLVEILIVLVIISILMALLFPAFKGAQERAAQSSCASNLKNIFMAVQQYKLDERSYPASLAVLLPGGVRDDQVLANTGDAADINGQASSCPTAAASSSGTCMNVRGTGYLKSGDNLLCSNDDRDDLTVPISSYGDVSTRLPTTSLPLSSAAPAPTPTGTPAPAPGLYTSDEGETSQGTGAFLSRYLWNYWGYDQEGRAFPTFTAAKDFVEDEIADRRIMLSDPGRSIRGIPPASDCTATAMTGCYDERRNPIANSLSNRYAPANTIITHCIFHRVQMANALDDPTALYSAAAEDAAGARDIVLRLDGSAKPVDVVSWNQMTNNMSQWQRQDLK